MDAEEPSQVQSPEPGDVQERLALVERGRPRPLSAQQREAVARRLAEQARIWPDADLGVVPDGTEPGFVFRARGQAGPAAEGAHGGG